MDKAPGIIHPTGMHMAGVRVAMAMPPLHSALMGEPLFRTIDRHPTLTSRPMHRIDAWRMIKQRAQAIGLPEEICCHTFRATGITAYLENGGTIEHAQPSPTTKARRRPSSTTAPATR